MSPRHGSPIMAKVLAEAQRLPRLPGLIRKPRKRESRKCPREATTVIIRKKA